MSNKVDRLFKEKLNEHAIPSSTHAWGKVEAHLTKKNKGIIWFRVAAVLALVSLLTFVFMNNGKEQPQQMAFTPAKAAVKANEKASSTIPHAELTLTQQEIRKEDNIVSKKQKQIINKSERKQKQEQLLIQTRVAQTTVITNEKKNGPPVIIPNEVGLTVAAQTTSQKSIKLTFSLPTLKTTNNEREEVMVAAIPEEKKTTLQKAVDRANEIRTGDVLGSLRDAKNDLFAWEFKKDKTKNNN